MATQDTDNKGEKMAKPYIKVVSIKDTKQGDCKLTLDMNQAGKELLMQAGVQKALSDYMVANAGKLSLWDKLKICWNILK
jgi:hypothetical protein